VHGENIGYARAGSKLAEELGKRDITVWDDDGFYEESLLPQSQMLLRGRDTDGHTAPPSPTNTLCYVSVPTHMTGYWDTQYKSIITMWEAKAMPESFRENFHDFDMIIVPSKQNLELFSQFHDNVQLMYLGVDPEQWHYRPVTSPGVEFRFLISGRGSRKGNDIAFEAFRRVFPRGNPLHGGPVPKLIMKAYRPEGKYYAPGVEPLAGKLTPEEELELYEDIHCYVQPSRGEGFGLQPLQAIAMGRPTILTNAHGHESFANLGIPISAGSSKADYFIYGDAGEWWEPNIDEVCEAMYDVYTNYEPHAFRAMQNSYEAVKKFNWKNTADRFVELLGDQMAAPYTGRGVRVRSTEKRLYKITVNQAYDGEVTGRSLHFEPGKVYYDFADVKRIFFDVGILSQECLEEIDHGLAPEQVRQLDVYKAHEAYCRTCGQMLNSGVKKSDLIYEEMVANATELH
jgi:glycosyltransferase involved in cell wall biosynthesis